MSAQNTSQHETRTPGWFSDPLDSGRIRFGTDRLGPMTLPSVTLPLASTCRRRPVSLTQHRRRRAPAHHLQQG